jgi:hypothetical protein
MIREKFHLVLINHQLQMRERKTLNIYFHTPETDEQPKKLITAKECMWQKTEKKSNTVNYLKSHLIDFYV